MTLISDPAHFIHDPATDRWLPMNKVATTLCAQKSKMKVTTRDLIDFKMKGFRCTLPNGQPIETGISA